MKNFTKKAVIAVLSLSIAPLISANIYHDEVSTGLAGDESWRREQEQQNWNNQYERAGQEGRAGYIGEEPAIRRNNLGRPGQEGPNSRYAPGPMRTGSNVGSVTGLRGY